MNKLLKLDRIHFDGMVLQSGQTVRLWGRCPAGAAVSARLDDRHCTVLCADGRFTVTIPPQPASPGHTIIIACEGRSIRLSDVCFGDTVPRGGQPDMGQPEHTVEHDMAFTADL